MKKFSFKARMKASPLLAAALPLLAAIAPSPALACGTDAYTGEICLMATNFCPRYTTEAAGQILAISQNTALFSLYGTTFGGNGTSNFALPDLRGRIPVGQGQGPGLSPVVMGEVWGAQTVTLTANNLPAHTHSISTTLTANTTAGTDAAPSAGKNALAGVAAQELTGSGVVAAAAWGAPAGVASSVGVAGLSSTVAPAGNNIPFSIQPPSLGLRYCVVLNGIFPSQN